VPLWLIIVAEKSTLAVYGNKTTESQSAQRTTTLGGVQGEKRIKRLCNSAVK
jgi:hypothetical protein